MTKTIKKICIKIVWVWNSKIYRSFVFCWTIKFSCMHQMYFICKSHEQSIYRLSIKHQTNKEQWTYSVLTRFLASTFLPKVLKQMEMTSCTTGVKMTSTQWDWLQVCLACMVYPYALIINQKMICTIWSLDIVPVVIIARKHDFLFGRSYKITKLLLRTPNQLRNATLTIISSHTTHTPSTPSFY